MSVTFTPAEQSTLRVAAYGAVTLMSFADMAGSPHKVATHGTLALNAATGAVGHVLASKKHDFKLKARSSAALADQVLPALAESMRLLEARDAAEAANFRDTMATAFEAAVNAGKGGPALAAMTRKLTDALDAA
ncbi:MAG TPA: hypothetical protein VGF17_02540 [Phytomonospora sp.]